MTGQLGFSYVGLTFLLMLMIPNFIWVKKKPAGYNPQNENKILLFLERMGQILVTCLVLIFQDFNLRKWSIWSWRLIAAFLIMVMYELWWLKYFKSERTLSDFYSSFLCIPVAGATLPICAFFFLGIYGRIIWMIPAVIILGIGHIGLHLQHRKELTAVE